MRGDRESILGGGIAVGVGISSSTARVSEPMAPPVRTVRNDLADKRVAQKILSSGNEPRSSSVASSSMNVCRRWSRIPGNERSK